MEKTIVLCDRFVCYNLVRKNVKNINVRIKPDGRINISANRYVTVAQIESFLTSKSEHIISVMDRFEKIKRETSEVRLPEICKEYYFLGNRLDFCVVRSHLNTAEIKDGKLMVYLDDGKNMLSVIEEWYDKQCRYYFGFIGKNVYELFRTHIKKYPEFSYKYMKSLWGSCNPVKYKISINKSLIRYDTRLIEFVFCHEFSHFICPDHSKKFYDVLSSVMPDHEERKKELKEKQKRIGLGSLIK